MNEGRESPSAPWTRVAAFIYIPLALIGAIWIVLASGRGALAERLIGERPLMDIAIGAACGLVLVILGRAMASFWGSARALEIGLARILGPVPPRACLLLALFSGIGEEIFFRAAMQPQLGYVTTSILFGVLHFPPSRELLLWLPLAMLAGFLFGGLFILTGSVVAPAVAHIVVNARNMAHLSAHWEPGGALHSSRSNNFPTSAG